MRRWTILGLSIMFAFILAANFAGPAAWAQEDKAVAYQFTVPTRTPTGGPTTPVSPTKKPKYRRILRRPPTATVAPTETRLPATLTPRPTYRHIYGHTAAHYSDKHSYAVARPSDGTHATIQSPTATVMVTGAAEVTATLDSTVAIPLMATAAP